MEKDLIPVKYVIVDNIIFYSRDTKISKNTINTGKDFEQTNNSSIYINPSLFYNNKVVYIYEWNQVIVETINNTFSESDFAEVGEYFKEDFGVLCFKDCIGPNTFLNINLFILSRKIEYNDFLLMIDYLNNKISNIAFSFNANTKINTRRSLSKRSEFDYYIFLYLLNIYDTRNVSNVFKFINVILNSPHKTMIKEYKKINSLFLETFDPDIIGEIASNPTNLITVNNTNLISSAIGNSSNNYFPRGIIIQNNRETFDTQENIFIKYFLTHSKFIMNQFLQKNTSPYKIKLVKKANDIIKKIDFIISTTYFKQVRTLDYLPYNSSVLKNKYGYKQIFDYYLKLSKAPITLLENEIIDELMDGKLLSTLYEYFCYFRIIDLIIDIYKCNPIITSNKIIKSNFSKKLSKLTNTVYSRFSDENKKLPDIIVNYNKTYNKPESYSKEYDPDISIEVIIDDTIQYILIFDAKFKMKNYNVKLEDIDKMHTYKDAIKQCIGAFVIFPGDENIKFMENKTEDNFISTRGVGAYALKPTSTKLEDIKSLIQEFLLSSKEQNLDR